jgi:hypothetical protein
VPDGAAGLINDGTGPGSVTRPYLDRFPYLGVPASGTEVPAA